MISNTAQKKTEQNNTEQKKTGKLICVTNRHLCEDDFLGRLRRIACAGSETNNSGGVPGIRFGGIMLREKDMSFSEYEKLALKVKRICDDSGATFIAHYFTGLDFADHLHLPLYKLKEYREQHVKTDKHIYIGASCHSVGDAQLAEKLGCSYITFGHVFETNCKKGLAPRGLSLLNDVVRSVSIPVYAIGGITRKNYHQVIQAGAAGACIMSGFMQCEDPSAVF